MIPEIILGSTAGTLTARMLNTAIDKYSNYEGDEITWDSEPDHHGGWTDSGWSCDQWMTWHKRLVEHYGNDAEAKEHFLREWNKQSTWDTQYNWCKYRIDFKNYFEAHGIGVHVLADIITDAGETASSVSESTKDLAEDGIGGFGDNISKILKWLPWIALAVAVALIYFHYRTVKKVAA